MSKQDILATLTEIMQDVLDDDDIDLTPESSAQTVGGWDSLANVRFVLAVSRKFNRHFAAAEIARLKNVGELVDLLAADR